MDQKLFAKHLLEALENVKQKHSPPDPNATLASESDAFIRVLHTINKMKTDLNNIVNCPLTFTTYNITYEYEAFSELEFTVKLKGINHDDRDTWTRRIQNEIGSFILKISEEKE